MNDFIRPSDTLEGHKEYIGEMNRIIKQAAVPEEIRRLNEMTQRYKEMIAPFSNLETRSAITIMSEQLKRMAAVLNPSVMYGTEFTSFQIADRMSDSLKRLVRSVISIPVMDLNGALYSLLPDDEEITEEEQQTIVEVDKRIVTEIYNPDNQIRTSVNSDIIIVAAPVNEFELKYFAENPDALYHLKPDDFEKVIAELYRKLGYDVERTKSTRDGGKDLIIRKSEPLGDLVYYVECKKYAPNRPIGVGIVRSMIGTLTMDKVNGGIIATTSYFSPDVRKLILDEKMHYQVQLHDINTIKNLLHKATN